MGTIVHLLDSDIEKKIEEIYSYLTIDYTTVSELPPDTDGYVNGMLTLYIKESATNYTYLQYSDIYKDNQGYSRKTSDTFSNTNLPNQDYGYSGNADFKSLGLNFLENKRFIRNSVINHLYLDVQIIEFNENEIIEPTSDDKIESGATDNVQQTNTVEREIPQSSTYIKETKYINTYDDKGELLTSTETLQEDEQAKNKGISYFEGYKIQEQDDSQTALEKLNATRARLFGEEGDSRYKIPWDWRFGKAYSNTQSIGNSMPKGATWVGSPTIMNPHALIRFSHVASLKQHINLLDQAGSHLFRTAGLVQRKLNTIDESITINLTDGTTVNPTVYNDETKKLQTTGNAPTQDDINQGVEKGDTFVAEVNKITEADKVKYNIPPGADKLWQDKDGNLYTISLDKTQKTWYIADEKATWTDSSGKQKTIELTPNNFETSLDRNGNILSDKDPNEITYWLDQNGLKQCKHINLKDVPAIYTEMDCTELQNEISNYDNQIEKGESASAKNDAVVKKQDLIKSLNQNYDKIHSHAIKGAWKSKDAYIKSWIESDKFDGETQSVLEPTIDNLCDVNNWGGKEQFLYNYSDFLYCSWFGRIPNNYLITLRRFPNPVTDNATIFEQSISGNFITPIAKAVTWIGEDAGNKLETIGGFGWKYNWRELNSSINDVEGNEQGPEQTPFGGLGKALGIIQSVASGGGGFSQISGWDQQRAKFDPYKDGMYANRINGPVNVIAKTKARERGLEFDHTITLNFQYSLKSIGGINPKAAMLDIIANMLALTSSNADFWGGANRYFPNKPSYPFPGGKKGFQQWYSGDFTGFIDSLGQQISSVGGDVMNLIRGLLTNPREALNTLLAGGAKTWMAVKQKDKRPNILTFKATLTGDPIGEWHLVVGNPFNPFMMIGNLIVTGAKIKFSEDFGIDDFPNDVSFEITLEHGKPRDKGDMESMLNRGEGRLHYAPFGVKDEAWNVSSATKDSRIDTSWKSKGSKTKTADGKKGDTISQVAGTAKSVLKQNTDQANKIAKMFYK